MGKRRDSTLVSVIARAEGNRVSAQALAETNWTAVCNMDRALRAIRELVHARSLGSYEDICESTVTCVREYLAPRFEQCPRCGGFVHDLREHRCPDEEANP